MTVTPKVLGAVAAGLSRGLEAATGAGYRLGYEIARDEAAFLALQAGQPALAEAIRALAPRPARKQQVT
ncbi:hypothetical protein ACQW02_20160 [Humitalea sp. 24SJ18S-53]|uniref:hypothetical protein n=1 Tax=Humitalea sp. 24SJ18S-53 TaxID=3422307 RepID=UPI003D66E8CD